MRKKITFFLIGLMILCITNNVYAADGCFNMLGANNQTVIPNGYTAYCGNYYASDQSNTSRPFSLKYSSNSSGNIFYAELDFTDLAADIIDIKFALNNNNYSVERQDVYVDSWDGLSFSANNQFQNIIIDEGISGCPKMIYWAETDVNRREIGFCADESCSITGTTIKKYILDNNSSLLYTNDDINFKTSSQISNELNKCNSDNTTQNDSSGQGGYIDNSTTSTTVVPIKSCNYYFGLDNYGDNNCYRADVKLVYEKQTQAGISKLKVSSPSFAGLDLSIIQEKLDMVDFSDKSTYSNINDYLIYDESSNTWTCADKMFILRNTGGNMPIFGYEHYSSSPYYQVDNSIEENSDSVTYGCPDILNGSDNGNDNFDDTCQGILTPELIDIINEIIFYMRILVPILLIILGSVDFGKVILSDNKDDLKKAGSVFIKRCIIGIAIFFVPTIISFLISVFNSVSDQSITDLINCGIQ